MVMINSRDYVIGYEANRGTGIIDQREHPADGKIVILVISKGIFPAGSLVLIWTDINPVGAKTDAFPSGSAAH